MLTDIRKITNIGRLVATSRLNRESVPIVVVVVLELWPLAPRATSIGVLVVMIVLWSFVLAVTVEILAAVAVGVPFGLAHDAFVFWLVLQLEKILPSTLNWFLCSIVHGQLLHFLELLDRLVVFSF